MTTTIPPARKTAAPAPEVATVQDVWELSDLLGVEPGAALASVEQLARGHAEDFRDVAQDG